MDKAFVELKGADRFTFASASTTVAEYSVTWLKRFVDNDTRYDPTGSAAGTGHHGRPCLPRLACGVTYVSCGYLSDSGVTAIWSITGAYGDRWSYWL